MIRLQELRQGVRQALLIRCSVACAASLAVAALSVAPAFASYAGGSTQYMWGDILFERGGTPFPHDRYRGVAANVWTYGPSSYGGAWWVVGGSAHARLSSIYIHRPASFHHAEAGIEKWGSGPPGIFWAYSDDGFNQRYGSVVGPVQQDAYTYLEVNNFTNSGSPNEEWRMAYGGILMKKAILPFHEGQMWMSTEVSNRYQDKRSQFRALQRRNPNGTWGWAQNMGERGGNLFNVTWGSYSPTHWYSWPTD